MLIQLLHQAANDIATNFNPETTFTLSLAQLLAFMSGIITAVTLGVGIYWRLNIKISKNTQEIHDNDKSVRYDMDQRFALLQLERKNCNEGHTHKIERLEGMMLSFGEKQDAVILNLNEQTKLLQALTTAFQKHETYHETVEKLQKK